MEISVIKITSSGATINVAGVEIKGRSIVIVGDKLICDDEVVGTIETRDVKIVGNVESIQTIGDVTVEGSVGKNVEAMGNVSVGKDVKGDVDSTGSVSVGGNVGGDIDTTGSVTVSGSVEGDIDAMGSVKVGKG